MQHLQKKKKKDNNNKSDTNDIYNGKPLIKVALKIN
jgi:hypothetical protein